MRRCVPWALVLLIGIGAGLGAALGAAGSPGTSASSVLTGPAAQQWVTGVLAATKAAVTAHLDSSSVTASPYSNLRGSDSGRGVVNFATGDFRVSDTEHSTEWTSENGGPTHAQAQTTTNGEIAIGRSVYENLGLPGFGDNWVKQPFPRDEGALGLGSADVFGAVLSPLDRPFSAVTVTDLGTTVVGGEPATRYLVQAQAEPSTGPGCPKSKRKHPKPLLGRTTVWVDNQGRLVQVRVISAFGGKLLKSLVEQDPSLADPPIGPFTLTSTLRFSEFGAPVHVVRPALGDREHPFPTVHITSQSSTGHGEAVFCG